MSNNGRWNENQLISSDWVRYCVTISTPWEEMEPPLLRLRGNPERWGFGAGWWVWDANTFPGNINASPFQGAYEARGTGGQFITVLPARGLILVHKTDIDADPSANLTDWSTITSMVIASACPNQHCSEATKVSSSPK